MLSTAGGAGRRAGSRKCRDDFAHGCGVWSDWGGDRGFGTEWNGEFFFGEGVARFGGSRGAPGGAVWNSAANFDDAIESSRISYAGVERSRTGEWRTAAAGSVGSGLVRGVGA